MYVCMFLCLNLQRLTILQYKSKTSLQNEILKEYL